MLQPRILRIAHNILSKISTEQRASLGCLRNLKIVKNNTGDFIVEITDRLAIDGLEMLE